MVKNLEGQVAVVFGGAGVIGSAMSKTLAANGATVGIMDMCAEPAQKVVDEIVSAGGKAAVFPCRADEEDSLEAALAAVKKAYGKIDICVSSIHRQFIPEYVVNQTWEYWERHIEAIKIHVFICKHVVPYMQANKYGRIIYISGGMCRRFYEGGSAYSCAKAGLNAFTKTLAMEVGKDNIMVNCIAPGRIVSESGGLTSEDAHALSSKAKADPTDEICEAPSGHYATAKHVAECVAWLASPNCYNTTGQTIYVGGGEIMPMP
ncbi:MAG: SDR family oxidoreductase [Oscillospiraceae bacterium]|nr:SDR family oxidoreductase [Oscillospiraceae bacterium]